MPSFYPPGARKGNRAYVVRGRIDGREYEIATDTTDEDDARAYWARFRRQIRDGDRHPDRATATFDDAVDLYEQTHDTSKPMRRYLKALRRELGGRRLVSITQADIHAAARRIHPRCADSTRNRQAVAPAAAVLHHAAQDARLCDYLIVRRLPEQDPFRPIAFPEETMRLARATRGHIRAVLLTLAAQGWRITETLNIRRELVDFAAGRVRRWVAKSRKWKWAAVDPDVLKAWAALPERPDGYIFRWRSRWGFYRDLRPVLKRAGVDWAPHMARRGFATALIEEGADLKSIMAAGGWEDIKSVMIYADVDLDQARRTIGRLRGRIRGKPRGKSAKAL